MVNGEYKNIMKNFLKMNLAFMAKNKMMMLIMAVVLIALPTMAQRQEWQSTSAMQTSGSALTPQVTAVGATTVGEMATTTENYSPAKAPGGPRRSLDSPGDTWQSEESPIGDALLPLSLMALAFCGVVYMRRKRLAKE